MHLLVSVFFYRHLTYMCVNRKIEKRARHLIVLYAIWVAKPEGYRIFTHTHSAISILA